MCPSSGSVSQERKGKSRGGTKKKLGPRWAGTGAVPGQKGGKVRGLGEKYRRDLFADANENGEELDTSAKRKGGTCRPEKRRL